MCDMTRPIFFALMLFCLGAAPSHVADPPKPPRKKVAALVTAYFHNSHADLLVSRLLETDTLDGKGNVSPLELVSLYTDQVPANDTSRAMQKKHGFRLSPTIADALTRGHADGRLAVDGVLLIAEHGVYPASDTGQTVYPKRRFFDETIAVFQKSERIVPLFIDKHLADNWADAKHIFDTAAKLKIPLMAGSCLPQTWRHPAVDVKAGANVKELVVVSFHTLDAYGFHALEAAQALVERRKGGETGIASVQCVEGDAVWQAEKRGVYDVKLLDAAVSGMKWTKLRGDALRKAVTKPTLCSIDYRDGLRISMITLNDVVGEWSAAWRDADTGEVTSTLFDARDVRPLMHFTWQLNGIESMMLTGKPAWPAERTLLTSGTLDALLISKKQAGKRIKTPQLHFGYESAWTWKQPPPPPKDRPLNGP